jgi:hypothetical protein
MSFGHESGSQFTPNGILRVKTDGNLLEEARKVLTEIIS